MSGLSLFSDLLTATMEYLTGYEFLRWIQTWSHPILDTFFWMVTQLGYSLFYFLLVPPLYWSVAPRQAARLFFLLILSAAVNTLLKLWVALPRPDPALLRVLDFRPYESGSFSFPSGHAQNAAAFWGYLAVWVKREWCTFLFIALIVLVGFSRLYLGVHYPLDVIGGFAIGGVLLGAYVFFLSRTEVHFRWRKSRLLFLLLIVLLPMGIGLFSPDRTVARLAGSFQGFCAGYLLFPAWEVPRRSVGIVWSVVGLGLLWGLSALMDELFPETRGALYVEPALLWFWVTGLYPFLARRVTAYLDLILSRV